MSEDAYVYIVEKCDGELQGDIIQNQYQGEHLYEGLQASASGNHGYKNVGKSKEGTTVVKPSEGKRHSKGRRTCLVVTSLLAVAAVAVAICLAVRLITPQNPKIVRGGPSILFDKNISLALTSMVGGKGGHWFTDALYASTDNNLTAINIWTRNNCVYGIQARYGSSWAPIRGPPSGKNYTFELQTGEFITRVDVGTGENPVNSADLVVCSLTFYTNLHTYGPYSSTTCTGLTTVHTGQGIAYLAGRLAMDLDAIMFYYYDRVVTSPLYGGNKGFQFDDTPYFRTNGLITDTIFQVTSESIVMLFVSYGGVATSSYGGVPLQSITYIQNTLKTVGDVINRVDVTWNADRVCNLTFSTLLEGTFPPVRASSCVPTYSTTVTMKRLLAFYGFYDRQLNAIGFHYV